MFEVELKFKIESPSLLEALWTDPKIKELEVINSRQEIQMMAEYYTTSTSSLEKDKIGLRVRQEGKAIVLTYKSKGTAKNGLHTREEINVPLNGLLQPKALRETILKTPHLSKKLFPYLKNDTLRPILKTNFIRKKCHLKVNQSLFELALDNGFFEKDNKKVAFSEIEIELIEGTFNDGEAFFKKLKKAYALQIENKSKLERGLML